MNIESLFPYVLKKDNVIKSFNPDLIYNSLIKETTISKECAEIIVKEITRFLIKIGNYTKTITAPMIREIANITLLEYGLEIERLKYTRIGFPRFDLTNIYSGIEKLKNEKPLFWQLEYEFEKEKIINHINEEYNAVNELIKKLELNGGK